MSRTVANGIAAILDLVNGLQPARQRGKTVANLMVHLERRATRTVPTAYGELRFLGHRGRHVAGSVDTFYEDEPETLAWIDAMAPGEVLWDIGASHGKFALYAGKRGLKVFAFEPKATNYGLLVEHVALNRLGDQVTPLNVALSDKTGLTRLHLSEIDAGGALNALEGSTDQFGKTPDGYSQPVFAARMDDIVGLYDLPAPDHIKLDVDGVESWILAGGPKLLKGVKSLIVEVEGENALHAEQAIDPALAAAGLVEDLAVRTTGSMRNRIYRRST